MTEYTVEVWPDGDHHRWHIKSFAGVEKRGITHSTRREVAEHEAAEALKALQAAEE